MGDFSNMKKTLLRAQAYVRRGEKQSKNAKLKKLKSQQAVNTPVPPPLAATP